MDSIPLDKTQSLEGRGYSRQVSVPPGAGGMESSFKLYLFLKTSCLVKGGRNFSTQTQKTTQMGIFG